VLWALRGKWRVGEGNGGKTMATETFFETITIGDEAADRLIAEMDAPKEAYTPKQTAPMANYTTIFMPRRALSSPANKSQYFFVKFL
jgi:hypothetical protein